MDIIQLLVETVLKDALLLKRKENIEVSCTVVQVIRCMGKGVN